MYIERFLMNFKTNIKLIQGNIKCAIALSFYERTKTYNTNGGKRKSCICCDYGLTHWKSKKREKR